MCAIPRRSFGETGLAVGVLGLGTWAFGGWSYGELDDREAVRIIEAALDAGIDFFDTASNYGRGRSEELLGEVLGTHRDRIVLCTKAGTELEGGRVVKRFDPTSLEASLDRSLARLRTDRVDILLLHNPVGDEAGAESAHAWLEREKRRGRIRFAGASMYGDSTDLTRVLGQGVDAVMARASALRSDFPDPWPARVAAIGRSPFESGWLTGRYGPESRFDPERDHRSRTPPSVVEGVGAALRDLTAIVERGAAASLSDLAIRHAAFGEVASTVVAGVTSVEQLRANIRAVEEGPLAEEAERTIRGVQRRF